MTGKPKYNKGKNDQTGTQARQTDTLTNSVDPDDLPNMRSSRPSNPSDALSGR